MRSSSEFQKRRMEWIENYFNNSGEEWSKFLEEHSKLGTWTDKEGMICQASALFPERHIKIVGTLNRQQGNKATRPYTLLDSVESSENLASLVIGYTHWLGTILNS